MTKVLAIAVLTLSVPAVAGLCKEAITGLPVPCIGTAAPSAAASTSGPVSDPGGTNVFLFNNAAGAITFNAPAGVAGYQRCYRNATTRTGAITIQMAASNTVDVNGVNGSSAGTLVSTGASGDSVCIVSDAANHWYAYIQMGSWTNN